MFGSKVKISKELYEKLVEASKILGCSSVDEYAEQILSREVEITLAQSSGGNLSSAEAADIANKLKGLGYLE